MAIFDVRQRLQDRIQATDEATSFCGQWPEPKPLPSGLPDVPPFAAELLPAAFRDWVMDVAERMQCPPDFPAVAVMVAGAGDTGSKSYVHAVSVAGGPSRTRTSLSTETVPVAPLLPSLKPNSPAKRPAITPALG